MHRSHEKTLKRMFKIEDKNDVTFSDELIKRIARAEARSVNAFYHLLEMSADTLLAVIGDMKDEDCLVIPEEKEEGIDYSKLSRPDLLLACDERDDLDIRGSESKTDLVKLLSKKPELAEA